jgi:hypothetical protein
MPRTRRRKRLERAGRRPPPPPPSNPRRERRNQKEVLEWRKGQIRLEQSRQILSSTKLLPDLVSRSIMPFVDSYPGLFLEVVGNPDYLNLGKGLCVRDWGDLGDQDIQLQCFMCLGHCLMPSKKQMPESVWSQIWWSICANCLDSKRDETTVRIYQCRHCSFCTFSPDDVATSAAPYCLRYREGLGEEEEEEQWRLAHVFRLFTIRQDRTFC